MFHKENWAGLERWLQAATTAYTPALGDLTPSLAVTSTSTSFHSHRHNTQIRDKVNPSERNVA